MSALLLVLAGVQSAWAQKMILKMAGQEPVIYKVSQMEYIMFEEGSFDEHEWVDLGLPSGTLWATCNIGAESPEDYGSYFAWGETAPKESYTWENYVWMTTGKDDWQYITKYTFPDNQTEGCWYSGNTFIGDGKRTLDTSDDAAFVLWGSDWRMPSKEQFEELIDGSNTTTEWTTQNGINGLKITSLHNGKSLFLPATGFRSDSSVSSLNTTGNYWTRTHDTTYSDHAFELYIKQDQIYCYGSNRSLGQSIRPIRMDGGSILKLVTNIVLNYTSLDLYPNDTQRLTATVMPSDAENKIVSWESSRVSVATVSTDGLVTAKSKGKCVITCKATDGSGVKAECQVNVNPILVAGILLDNSSLYLKKNESWQLTATVLPESADNKTVTWESSNTSVATDINNGLVTAKAIGTCTITCSATDGSGVTAECKVTVTSGPVVSCPDDHHPHAIDLGLPSGTKWACCNVGASTPEGYGGLYSWGETKTKSHYDWDDYTLCISGFFSLTKYCTDSMYGFNDFTDNLTELLPEDDAATVNMGTSWCMPSIAQIEELLNKCSSEEIQVNGMNVIHFIGPNGNQIILPLAGHDYYRGYEQAGIYGDYWSRSLHLDDNSKAGSFWLYIGNISKTNYEERNCGLSVRAVRK